MVLDTLPIVLGVLSVFLMVFLVIKSIQYSKIKSRNTDLSKVLSEYQEQTALELENIQGSLKELTLENSTLKNMYASTETKRQEELEHKGQLSEKYSHILSSYDDLSTYTKQLEDRLYQEKEASKKRASQHKSSEVRVGKIAENMAPFLTGFPYNPKNCRFLGDPIDFVCFDEEGVHFIEVKSGKSTLSTKQRKIRDSIKDGKVSFQEYRVKGEEG